MKRRLSNYESAIQRTAQQRLLDALAAPIQTRWTDNSMPVIDPAQFEKPAVFRRLSIGLKRLRLERQKRC